MSPEVGASKPAKSRSMVDFPQPDGPMIARPAPGSTENETPASAWTSSYCFATERNSNPDLTLLGSFLRVSIPTSKELTLLQRRKSKVQPRAPRVRLDRNRIG